MNHDEQAEPLLPCPFCGGDADIFSLDGVRCLNEKCEAELPMNGNYEEAIAAWNSRTTPPVTSTEGEAFEAAYHKLSFQEYPNEMESHRAIWNACLSHQAQRQAVGEDEIAKIIDDEIEAIGYLHQGQDVGRDAARKIVALASLSPPAAVGWLPIYDWARSGMDIVRSKLERNNVYLQGKNGDVFRVWLDFDGMPSIEMVLANAPLPTPPAAVDEDEAVDIMANAYNGVIPGDHNGLRSAFRAIRQHLKGELALPTWKKAFITAEADSGANKYRIVAKFENIELMHAGHAELISVLLPVGESQSEDV